MIRLMLVLTIASLPLAAPALTVKSVACASGTLNPNGTLKPGENFGEADLRALNPALSSVLEVGQDVVVAVHVPADTRVGACDNHGIPTALVLILAR